MITLEELKEYFFYDQVIGIFLRKKPVANCSKVGEVAGHINKKGYIIIKFRQKAYKAHRLAWFYVTGEWPKDQIDHINRDKTDNRFDNLREADNSLNVHNVGIQKNNTSGYKGVSYDPKLKMFRAYLDYRGQRYFLKLHDTALEASLAREAKFAELEKAAN